MRLFSYPKVNLALDILQKTPSEYHEIRTILHEIKNPYDEITLQMRDDGICEVVCNNKEVPLDHTNTALKAAYFLKKHIEDITRGVTIYITKKIPLMSGLGGGSSNAVATLKGLAQLWNVKCCKNLNHDSPKCLLWRIAGQIGMDCPFFFLGGTAHGEHYGEKIIPLPSLPTSLKFEIIDTDIEMSSHVAYRHLNLSACGKNIEKTETLIKALTIGDAHIIIENIHNDFEESIFGLYPRLRDLKEKLERQEKCRVLLCGSGGALVKIMYYGHES